MRLLDETGQEVFRIGTIEGNSIVVAEEDWQNQSNRYYFTDSYQLDKGGLYVSPLDLNTEHGQIEVPYKPMIRFVAPVYASRDNGCGSLVLNSLGNDLIKLLQTTSANALGTLMLLNNDGYWLIADNPGDGWGFILEERKDRTFQNDFPDIWSVLKRSAKGQVRNMDGLH